ncbi:fibronectin type III domain-containing protein [Algoriphagus sp. AGSA1]|uniref:fibronectin type III domain-containing protein n=1 Tax=Algoriphagus sp. AGSA1 TaxID=2907213 RepID=UPI001F31AA39|nr:fibronectin type III domain-containing protein [Algoriphagus sp. AGSA1]MCE7054112.1 fibronectin type III domain-containing protein [Algoriphagus sp. AGSA1]
MLNKIINLLLVISILVVSVSCTDDDAELPFNPALNLTSTNETAPKTYTSIEVTGQVQHNEKRIIQDQGIVWGISQNPTISDNFISTPTDEIEVTVSELNPNTTYFFRVYASNGNETLYSGSQEISTLSLENTSWKLTTSYPDANDFKIIAQVDFYADQTTKFDEMDLPMHCPGCYIAYGSWSLDGNNLTYIWEGDDPENSTYIYNGVVEGMSISGTYTHSNKPEGVWTAAEL